MKPKFLTIMLLTSLLCGCVKTPEYNNSPTSSNTSTESKATYNNTNYHFSVNDNYLLANLNDLCSNIRNLGSQGELAAYEFLNNKLESYGYNVESQSFDIYEHSFDSTLVNNSNDYFILNPYNSNKLGSSKNIIATQKNYDKNKKTLYLTAHYDTTDDTTGIFDNGSGCSVVLELARLLNNYNENFNIKIVFFSAEEYYRYGSRYFVSNLSKEEKDNVLGCLNIDMVGELEAREVVLETITGKNNILSLLVNNNLDTPYNLYAGGGSDDLSFYFGQMPTITLSNINSNPHLATTANQSSYLDLNQLTTTCKNIIEFITSFDINTYNQLLSEKHLFDDMEKNKFIQPLDGFQCIDSTYNLIDNGYATLDTFSYKNALNNTYTITRTDLRFYHENLNDLIMVDAENNNGYKILKSSNPNYTKIFYVGKSYSCGEIEGEISLNQALSLVDSLVNFTD